VNDRRAVVVVRNGFLYDARVLRAARTLAETGLEPLVVASQTEAHQPISETRDGLAIVRVRPSPPIAWVQRALGGRRTGVAADPAVSPPSRGVAGRVGLRAFRWLRTADYNWRVARVVLRERPVLVHCNDHNTMWVGVAAKLLARSRLVYDAHELWADRNGRWEWRPWLLATEALFTRVADQTVVASPGFVDPMSRRYRIAPPRVVRNIPARADALPPRAEASGDAIAVYVGALLKGRGLEQAIDAIALAPGVRLRLIGPGAEPLIAALRRRAAGAGVEDRVEFLPPVAPDRVVDALAGADLGLSLFQPVCLSHELTLPNKLFEYLAAGLPILSSDMSVSAEFVRRHGVGEVVPATSPSAIAAGVRSLLAPGRRDELAPHIELAAREFSWEAERRELLEAYTAAAR
jgi:glycosyltransferase involved in cell wall biosynthesis